MRGDHRGEGLPSGTFARKLFLKSGVVVYRAARFTYILGFIGCLRDKRQETEVGVPCVSKCQNSDFYCYSFIFSFFKLLLSCTLVRFRQYINLVTCIQKILCWSK